MSDIPTVAAPLTPKPGGDTGIQSATPGTGGLTGTQQNAWAILQQLLQSYGFTGNDLTNLVAWAKGQIVAGNSSNTITLNLQQTPQFEARFPAIGQLSKEGVAITPADYINLEQSYAQLEQQAGLPANFASYDQLIGMQVSPTEYADRINNGYLAVANADPTVIQAFQDYYGTTKGQLAAYFLNPTKALPLLQQQAVSAQIGGAATQSNYEANNGGLSQQQALRLAQMGVTQPTAQQGFQKLGEQAQLTGTLAGQGQAAIGQTQLLNEQFGSDAQTALELKLRGEYEAGTTQGGTQVGQTSGGATGLGAVQR